MVFTLILPIYLLTFLGVDPEESSLVVRSSKSQPKSNAHYAHYLKFGDYKFLKNCFENSFYKLSVLPEKLCF